jgi:hypothetical protein
MATQNINNFYFNKLDAKLDFSSYHDFFLASDERDYNWEVVYSKYPIGVYGNESSLINGIAFSSSVLGSWFDLNVNDCTKYTNLTCSSNNDDNTLLSLSYWDKAKPTIRDAKCSCTTCETAEYVNEADYVKTICDVGLTGVDNGLTDYMKGIDNTCNMCEREFVITGTSNGTMVGTTIVGTSSFIPNSWSSNLPFQPTCVSTCTYPNVAVVGGFVVSEVGTVTNDNFDSIICSDLTQASCCFMTGGTAYSFTLSNAKLVIPLTSGSTYGVFTATTTVESGYLSVPCDMDKITLWETLPSIYEFDRLKYDKRLKLTPVGAGIDTGNNLSYKMTSVYESSTGYYQQLDGGFYQGFYKLEGQPYEVLPTRTECGWTVDNTIKVRTGAVCGGNTLNGKYPNNAGFFWYMGARAENKFWNIFSGESGVMTCDSAEYNCSGKTTDVQQTKDNIVNNGCNNRKIIGELETYDHKIDSMSNAFGLRLTPDYRIGFRALYYTSSCVVSGECITASTYTTGYTIVEEYSDLPVCGLESPSVVSLEPWLLVTARFERNFCYDGCDLENKGGVNDLRVIDTPLGDTTHVVREKIETSIEFHQNWMDERKYRLGTLTIFVNGRPALVVEDFEEIIPRRLNTDYRLQVGVPYNMSWGGGSQGLLENLTFSGTTCSPYVQNNKDLGLLIESNFAGTYDGGISQMRYYLKPLTDDEVIHNYLVNKDRYNLKDCECDFTLCREGRTIYRTEGDSVDIDITFAVGMTVVAVDKLGSYINSDEWTGVKFTNVTIGDVTNNVTGYSFQVIEDMGLGTVKNVSIPFYIGPNEIIKIIINKIDINIAAKIIIYGNLYK